jgi:hypothetical protein
MGEKRFTDFELKCYKHYHKHYSIEDTCILPKYTTFRNFKCQHNFIIQLFQYIIGTKSAEWKSHVSKHNFKASQENRITKTNCKLHLVFQEFGFKYECQDVCSASKIMCKTCDHIWENLVNENYNSFTKLPNIKMCSYLPFTRYHQPDFKMYRHNCANLCNWQINYSKIEDKIYIGPGYPKLGICGKCICMHCAFREQNLREVIPCITKFLYVKVGKDVTRLIIKMLKLYPRKTMNDWTTVQVQKVHFFDEKQLNSLDNLVIDDQKDHKLMTVDSCPLFYTIKNGSIETFRAGSTNNDQWGELFPDTVWPKKKEMMLYARKKLYPKSMEGNEFMIPQDNWKDILNKR